MLLFILLIVGFLIAGMVRLVTVYPSGALTKALNAIDMGNTAGEFTVTSLTSSPTLTSVSPSPLNLIPGTTIYFPSALGTFTTGTVLSVTTNTIVLTGNAPTALTAQNVIAINGGSGQLNGLNMRLFKSSYSPGPGTVLADLTAIESTFGGYAAIAIALTNQPVVAGTPYVQSQLLRWDGTGVGATETVYGWWIDDGTTVLRVGTLSTGVAMGPVGSVLSLVFQDSFPPGLSVIQVSP